MEEAYKNDELNTTNLKCLLVTKWRNVSGSISTMKLTCKETEWVCALGR